LNKRQKTVYRDKATNRLIPRKVAAQRDASTWNEEPFTFSDHSDSEQPSSESENPAYSVGAIPR